MLDVLKVMDHSKQANSNSGSIKVSWYELVDNSGDIVLGRLKAFVVVSSLSSSPNFAHC